jgi:tRNA(Arg) A34 adenosine deaminase TadA
MTVDGRPQSGRPRTRHAETNVVRVASERFDPEFLQGCTVYTSTEPCAICAGAIFWANVRRVMFVLSEQDLRGIAGGNPENHDSGDLLSGDLRSRRPQGRSQRSNTCGSRHERCTRASGPDRPSARRAAHASTDEAVHRFSFAAATHSTGRRIHEGVWHRHRSGLGRLRPAVLLSSRCGSRLSAACSRRRRERDWRRSRAVRDTDLSQVRAAPRPWGPTRTKGDVQ